MAKITIADALYYYVPDYATVRIDGYNNNKPFKNSADFRNSGDDILKHTVNCFYADGDVLGIQLYE